MVPYSSVNLTFYVQSSSLIILPALVSITLLQGCLMVVATMLTFSMTAHYNTLFTPSWTVGVGHNRNAKVAVTL